MDLLRKYFLPLYETADPAAPPAVDPAAALDPPPVDPADFPDPAGAPDAATAPRMVPQEIFLREVAPLRAKTRELEAERDQARREAAEARALAERLSRREGDPPAPAPRAEAPAVASDQDVETRAAQLVFAREAQAVSQAGARKFGAEWHETVNMLEALNLNNGEFVNSVMEIDRAHTHEIMHAIAKDPEKAAAIAAMPSARRFAEIARISDAMAAKTDPAAPAAVAAKPAAAPAKTVSRAPAPAPPIDPSASKVVDGYADEASDEEFTRQFNERMKQRATQGRR